MKNIIEMIIRTGFSKSKRPLEKYIRYLYPLEYILTINELGWVVCNDNEFWNPENNQKRLEFLQDIHKISKKSMKDNSYFHFINRFENGDRYGIEVN